LAQAPTRRVLVIANPVAGRGRGARAAEVLVAGLRAEGVEVELFATSQRGSARDRAAAIARDVDTVAVVGGDGTLNEVLSGLPRRDVRVAPLPMGTANVLGLDLGLRRDPAGCVRTILAGRTQALDIARIESAGSADAGARRLCFLGASAGYDASVVHELERLRRGPITRLSWARAALTALRAYEPPRIEVEADGKLLPGVHGMVLLANVVNYAGWPSLAGDRRLDDGLFEAYLFPARSRAELLRHGARGLLARFPGGGVVRVTGRRFRVASARPVPLQVDGDAAGSTPFELTVEAERFRILVP